MSSNVIAIHGPHVRRLLSACATGSHARKMLLACWWTLILATGRSALSPKIINTDSNFPRLDQLSSVKGSRTSLNPFYLPSPSYFTQLAETCTGSPPRTMSETTLTTQTDDKLAGMDHAEVHYFNRCVCF